MTKACVGEGPIAQCYTTLGEASPNGSEPRFEGARFEDVYKDTVTADLDAWRSSEDPRIAAAREKNEQAMAEIRARQAVGEAFDRAS